MTTDGGLPFDLSTVKTKADEDHVRKNKRIFGIKEAPTFYPTREEFKDPLSYIEKISPQGEKYGIIKIVPPKDYKPEFSLKTENFRFKTRIQKLNSMEGETRTNVNYLEQLTKYHILTGRPVGKIPQLDKRPIDLYKLKNEVAQRGGVQEVTRLKKWAEIGRNLGYARKQCTSMSNALKSAYQKVILPYEIWYAKHKEDVEHIIKKEDSITNNSGTSSDTCEICQKNENEEKLLLCDGCNRGYHMYCLSPPLNSIPKTDWYCLQCLTAVGKDYGFEDGEEYSLGDFHKVCDKFKKEWFEKLLGHQKPVSEEDCENEFWRLVENPHETCQVEYGADLHSTQHGSGFMAAEQMPRGAFDPWNLNVIPVDPKSLFTHIKTDISGMMVPWLYVGMCFSAFCWHNEDHYTYSINYMHWGETKTWYGVPGSDTAKFEETMKKAVPELFEQQPDLLFQLVTMLSPGRLLKENVDVYAVDQRPGQFVITYPKAYHSGFNHGFNFCEAVNFAPGEWVDYGLECVKRYKDFRRQPCFSHDELLVTAAQNIKSTNNMDWLKRGLVEMQKRELKERNAIRTRRMKESLLESDTREELQCVFCNCYTYLSHIACECTDKVSCLDHSSELCTCDLSSKTLHLRFTDKQLDEMTKNILHSDSNPDDWIEKLNKAITSKPSPTMKGLKELLKEGQEASVPQESLDTLKDYIDVVDNWCSDAEKLLSLKSESKSSSKKRDQRIRDLIHQAALIGFDLPHVKQLKTYAEQLEAYTAKLTDHVLASTDRDMQSELYQEGLQLRADSIRFNQLKNSLESCSWEEQVEKAIRLPFNPKTIRKLIKDAEDLGMTDADGPWLKRLIIMEERGRDITQHIENICKGREKIEFDQENTILQIGENKQDPNVSIILDPHLLNRLKNAMSRSKSTIREIENMLDFQTATADVAERPSLTDAQRLMSMCRELSFKTDLVTRLSNALTQTGLWNDQLRSTFMNGRQKSLETVIRETLNNVQRITTSEDKKGIWCVCRKAEAGLMIECDICHEWYHSSCLKVPRNVVRSSSSYVCPICNPTETTKKITHLSRQPKLEEISDLLETGELLKFKPKDYSIIVDIHSHMQQYRNRVQAFCRSRPLLGLQDLPKIRFYLRTMTGLEVALQDETDFLRTKIQALAPISSTLITTTSSHKITTGNVENTAMKPTSIGSDPSTPDRKLSTESRK
ncbi:uncharacterized protein EV154DRAFT_429798 [Mucor mucedo]|uniref:uncharacterized protein n=1 Tax=Mucor mucedo TaxID=29922 RepID=UPI00221F9B7C|nr:uncharacterized protein EV154DRAFT_429798 [Mucor mucedo]KAI7876296.1 hypothetical protein EV154DRAFT_429798 [Mucor mucedo]